MRNHIQERIDEIKNNTWRPIPKEECDLLDRIFFPPKNWRCKITKQEVRIYPMSSQSYPGEPGTITVSADKPFEGGYEVMPRFQVGPTVYFIAAFLPSSFLQKFEVYAQE